MKKIYHLSTCDTCKRIIKELPLPNNFVRQDIKKDEISVKQLEELYSLTGSYESLFSKRAKLYKERRLKDENLSERDFRNLLLEHYTFLSRPVIIVNSEIFIGNSKKTIEAARTFIQNKV